MKKILFFTAVLILIVGLTCNSGTSASYHVSSKNAAEKMQEFVIAISKYSRSHKPNFIIIPQNGEELAFQKARPDLKLQAKYLEAVDGFGIEELFYNESLKPNNYRLESLRKIVSEKPVWVSDFVADERDVFQATQMNDKEGFLSFVRTKDNYHYTKIPEKITNENSNDILTLKEAKNFLYLINASEYTTKAAFLKALQNTNYDVLLIDLFYNGMKLSPEEVQSLQQKSNGGKRLVIAYLNIGAAEKYRYYWDKSWTLHQPSWLAKPYDGYEQEIWVEYWNKDWQEIIFGNDDSYLKKILNAGFDGAYLDNTEAFYFLFNS